MITKELKTAVKIKIAEKDMTQKKLAEILNVTPSYLSHVLNGNIDISIKLARKFYSILNIDPHLILKEISNE